MANSRSNIYPVQLQGAELCLNKYDAEIKQYSGFNNNNSPFVGGCLSNVFTKEDSIEGATDDNTIITENGDKYTVDTEGFYRNGEKLVSYPSGTTFFEERKLDMPVSVLKVLSDNIYIFKGNYAGEPAYLLHTPKEINGQIVMTDVLLAYVITDLTDEEYVFERFHHMFITAHGMEYLIYTFWDNTITTPRYRYVCVSLLYGDFSKATGGTAPTWDQSNMSSKLW